MANPTLLSPSFFTRLYLSILFAVVFSFALTQYFVEGMMEQDSINDFVRDSTYISNEIRRQIDVNKVQKPLEYNFNLPLSADFDIRWLPENEIDYCQQCEYLGSFLDVDTYELADDAGMLAVHSYPQFQAKLLIADNMQSPHHEGDNAEIIESFTGLDVAEAVFIFFVLILLLIISITIYWPVRQLQKQINALVTTTKTFGAGELDTRANEQLTKPLNKLAYSFNSMASAIADTVQENQIFAQAVPHEVRTPLSRIQLAAGLLRKGCENEKHIALLDNIDTYIDDIDELISQVVAFSKLNATVDDDESDYYQSIEFAAFISSRVQSLSSETGIEIELDIDAQLEITTNPVYLRLLLDNLIKNALSHGKALIKISVQLIQNQIEINVIDDGLGIPEEFQETIFFPFARLDKSRSRKTGGLGLGLAIAKSASKRMKGDLSVKNVPNGGAQFICRFLS